MAVTITLLFFSRDQEQRVHLHLHSLRGREPQQHQIPWVISYSDRVLVADCFSANFDGS